MYPSTQTQRSIMNKITDNEDGQMGEGGDSGTERLPSANSESFLLAIVHSNRFIDDSLFNHIY